MRERDDEEWAVRASVGRLEAEVLIRRLQKVLCEAEVRVTELMGLLRRAYNEAMDHDIDSRELDEKIERALCGEEKGSGHCPTCGAFPWEEER